MRLKHKRQENEKLFWNEHIMPVWNNYILTVENIDSVFYYNFKDKYCGRKDFELTQMEKDSLYMFEESLNVAIK